MKSLSDEFDILDTKPKGILDALDDLADMSSDDGNFSDTDENAEEIRTVR